MGVHTRCLPVCKTGFACGSNDRYRECLPTLSGLTFPAYTGYNQHMPTTRQQIEAWKARLLDLSLRNRLLHVRFYDGDTQRTVNAPLRLMHPNASDLFDLLVRHHRRLPFAFQSALLDLPADSYNLPATGETIRLDRLPPPPLPPPDLLMSDLAPDKLEPALYNLRLRARNALSEQGVNVLFVVLGFLEWFDPITPEQILRSPLLLLPVELQRVPLGREYALRLLDDEVILNPTLAHKLRLNYGLTLPDLPEDIDELDLDQFFTQVAELTSTQADWQVIPDAALGLFSFLKLLMYHDMQYAAEHAVSHPLLTWLSGEGGPNQPTGAPLDSLHPAECFQVLDADASQQEALAAARAGASFVLQGPPGTGKSQTIANIIAEGMADGKRILFVSEKMAALQVVHERLRQCDLADFCLELHSHRTGKRAVLDDLAAALEPVDLPPDPDFPYDELAALRDQLNAYARALHTPLGTLGWTAHTVYGRLQHVRDTPDSDAPMGNIAAYTSEQIGRIDILLRQVDSRRDMLNLLRTNPWRGCTMTTGSFEERGRIRNRLRSLITTLRELVPAATAVAAILGLPPPDGLITTRALAALGDLLREPYATGLWLRDDPLAIQYLQFDIADARQCYTSMAEIEAQLGRRYTLHPLFQTDDADVLPDNMPISAQIEGLEQVSAGPLGHLDVEAMLVRFEQAYANGLRYLRPGYYRDMAALRKALKPRLPLTYATALADLRLAATWQVIHRRLEGHIPALAARSGKFFAGRRTDWNAYEDGCAWTLKVLALALALPRPLPDALIELANQPLARRTALLDPVVSLHAHLDDVARELAEFTAMFPPPLQLADTFADLLGSNGVSAPEYSDPVTPPDLLSPGYLLEHMADLDVWWEFCTMRRKADELGIAAYLDALSAGDPAIEQPQRAFYKRFCCLWLDMANRQLPALQSFQREAHEALIERFRVLDAAQLVAARVRLRTMLLQRRPSYATEVPVESELGILRREVQKQRRHKAIRPLLREIPTLLGQLKPCLMMSPLSVSQFLDPQGIQFDLVIFDEASQICTEDAIGAIMRSKAMIVVGDNRQLPPTSFFMASNDAENDLDEPDQMPDAFESILDACMAVGVPTRMLRWHYRSRHEALIAFSNQHFYAQQLATFPAAQPNQNHGIVFEHVAEGMYDRRGTRTNQPEAQRVADLVCAHVHRSPQRSLGVVAFSQAQQLAILGELEHRYAADPSLALLFDEDRLEPFFVKNLENVQGDERDVIIFSIGYGSDSRGRMLMNFGPLNQQGGERRLNVAVTRAREQMLLVSSLLPSDIDPHRVKQPGPLLLRDYLEYAENGGPLERRIPGTRRATLRDQQNDTDAFPSIEDELVRTLAETGVPLNRQIGHSAFRIDIAVREAHTAGHYLLGIECDGNDYRDAPTARDRERLREQVLANLGWRIHRVWSAAWFQDPQAELDRIFALINDAL